MDVYVARAPTSGRPVRLVTVDDQPFLRQAAEAIVACTPELELVGASTDGPSALQAISELDPDMVIVDVRMPGMDGIEVARRLRSRGRACVVVLVTTMDTLALAQAVRGCGAAALIRKQWLTPRLLCGLWIAHRRR